MASESIAHEAEGLMRKNKKNLAQKWKFVYDKQIWKQMFAEIPRFK